MHVHKKQLLLTLILRVAAGRQSAQASGITGEQIIATFGGVVVAGSIANDPSAGVNTYLNNATTAVYNINNNVVCILFLPSTQRAKANHPGIHRTLSSSSSQQ